MKHGSTRTMLYILTATLCVMGCDYVDRRATENERANRLYQAAMEEYAAGRLDKAIDAFEKLLKSSPGNASARFQLACLLQDHRRDMLGAICNYREYLALSPNGDKVGIAKDRSNVCERQLAVDLVKKYNLGGIVAQDEANARLRADNAKLVSELDAAKKDVDKLKNDLAALQRENERVRRMVLAEASTGATEEEAPVAKSKPVIPDEKELLEDEATDVDRVKFSADVANLIAEEKDETSQSSPFGKTVRKPPAKPTRPELQPPPHEERPDVYVVQEGDTLFKLAIRFYGRRSAWSQIRDANKTQVSADGRIKAGQKLRMP